VKTIRLAVAFLATLSPALAAQDYQHRSDSETCASGPAINADLRVRACESEAAASGQAGDLSNLGLALITRNENDKALAALTQAIALDPTLWQAYVNRAQAYYNKAQYDAALADANSAIAAAPKLGTPYVYRAVIYRAKAQPDLAQADFDHAVAVHPSVRTYTARGSFYADKRDNQHAIDDYTAGLKIWPDDMDLILRRAALYWRTDQDALADSEYRRALTVNDITPYGRGLAEDALKMDDKAVADFSQALVLNPGKTDALYHRGHIYARQGKTDLALADFDAVLAVRADPASMRGRADVFLTLNKAPEAEAAYTQVIAVAPRDAYSYANRSSAYKLEAKFDQAMADINKAIELAPNEPSWLGLRAALEEQTGDLAHALADYAQTTTLDPKDNVAWNGACWLRASHNIEIDKALDACNMALKANPPSAEALDSMGLVQYRLGHYGDALARYNAALAANPKQVSSLYMRGIVEKRTGNATAGDMDIAAATTADPTLPGTFAGYGVSKDNP
jgi:tetratricopeptide (TPR) repeat protein